MTDAFRKAPGPDADPARGESLALVRGFAANGDNRSWKPQRPGGAGKRPLLALDGSRPGETGRLARTTNSGRLLSAACADIRRVAP